MFEPVTSFEGPLWFWFKVSKFPIVLLPLEDWRDGGILIDFDDERDGRNRNDLDRSMNFAKPSNVAIELLLLVCDWFPLLSLEELDARRPLEEMD